MKPFKKYILIINQGEINYFLRVAEVKGDLKNYERSAVAFSGIGEHCGMSDNVLDSKFKLGLKRYAYSLSIFFFNAGSL